MNSTKLRIRFFLKIATLLLYAKFKHIDLMPTCFHRSEMEQLKMYAQGRTEPGKIITYCDGFRNVSKHQKWRAFDFVVVVDGKLIWKHIKEYDKLGAFWKKLGGVWGGDFVSTTGRSLDDCYHFEDKT